MNDCDFLESNARLWWNG